LIKALKEGVIGGAYLDVFRQEPLAKDNELWDLPNVLLAPHSAGATSDFYQRAFDIQVENITRFCKGEPLNNLCDKRQGY
jgi:phosphoglycerate dehydrogenase-like enzyme